MVPGVGGAPIPESNAKLIADFDARWQARAEAARRQPVYQEDGTTEIHDPSQPLTAPINDPSTVEYEREARHRARERQLFVPPVRQKTEAESAISAAVSRLAEDAGWVKPTVDNRPAADPYLILNREQ
jgi:hypothetical protein